MTTSHKITTALAVVLAGFFIFAGYGWVKEHEANAVMAVQQKANEAAAAALKSQEQANQQALADALKSYAAMKQQVQTPAQVVKALPVVINLPSPIVPVTEAQAQAANAATPNAPKLATGDLIIPAQSVKAFYDAQVDCKANETKAISCGQTIANLNAVMAVKETEIAQLKIVNKGGTKVQRAKSALKFSAIGAVVGGAVAAYFIKR